MNLPPELAHSIAPLVVAFATSVTVFRLILLPQPTNKPNLELKDFSPRRVLLEATPNNRPLRWDFAWVVFFALVTAITTTQAWPWMLHEARGRPRRVLVIWLTTCALDTPFLILDRWYLSENLIRRFPGGLVPITTTWTLLRAIVNPLILMLGFRFVNWMQKPKKISYAAIDRLLRPCEPPHDETCGICRDDFDDPKELPCAHVFCKECVRLALRARAVCPVCGKEYKGKQSLV